MKFEDIDVQKYWTLLLPNETVPDSICQGLVLRQNNEGYVFNWEDMPSSMRGRLIQPDGSVDRIYSLCRVPDLSSIPLRFLKTPLEISYWKLLSGYKQP